MFGIGSGVDSGDYMLCFLDCLVHITALDMLAAEDIASGMQVRGVVLQGFLHGEYRL